MSSGAEATVREASNLTASEALALNVIDIVAEDLSSLLADINGRTVNAAGMDVVIDTSEGGHPSSSSRIGATNCSASSPDPNVAYILLMIGIYGLILEFYNPGVGIGAGRRRHLPAARRVSRCRCCRSTMPGLRS